MSSNINILIVEDEPIIAEDISDFLTEKGYGVAGICYTVNNTLTFLDRQQADLVLLDINLGKGAEGIEIARMLSKKQKVPFIFLTSYTDKKTIDQAKRTYPMGYIPKPIDFNSLFTTIEISLFNFSKMLFSANLDIAVINQNLLSQITQKEFDVLSGIYKGRNNKQIAEENFVSVNTIKTHIKNLYDKLNVHSRSELLARIRALSG